MMFAKFREINISIKFGRKGGRRKIIQLGTRYSWLVSSLNMSSLN
jgi:hypothetical protein